MEKIKIDNELRELVILTTIDRVPPMEAYVIAYKNTMANCFRSKRAYTLLKRPEAIAYRDRLLKELKTFVAIVDEQILKQ